MFMKEKKVMSTIQRRLLQPATGYSADARIDAIREALDEWKKAPERIALFKQLAQDERNVMVRLEALDSLYLERKHDLTIMPFIRQRFLDERSPAIKLSIINRQDRSDEIRAMIWIIADDEQKSDEAIAEILERREGPDIFKSWRDGEYQLETETSVPYKHRVEYILRMARERRQEPDTLGWLKERAEHAECTMVRQTAIEEIAREWAREPGTLEWLKERGVQDESDEVRGSAYQEIARRYSAEPWTLEWLQKIAEHFDNGCIVRHHLLLEIARNWIDDPTVLPWLKSRIEHDSDSTVRNELLIEFAGNWTVDSETCAWLKERAEHDEALWVRKNAIDIVAEEFGDNPGTLEWLRERAVKDAEPKVRKAARAQIYNLTDEADNSYAW